MTDIALFWSREDFTADLMLDAGQLATDEGLRTAFLISIFTDARARDDDVLPQEGGDRRGWWGNAFADAEGDEIGSRFWLLDREKKTPRVIERARDYARECVQWLIRDGICTSIDIDVEAQPGDRIAVRFIAHRPGGPARQAFDFLWEGTS